MIDVSNYKLVYKDKVFNCLSIGYVEINVGTDKRASIEKPEYIDVLAIDENGNIISIYDHAYLFQFIPKVTE